MKYCQKCRGTLCSCGFEFSTSGQVGGVYDKRPREWWIRERDVRNSKHDFFEATLCNREPNPALKDEADFFHHIHVIEKSAYDALAKENETLKQTLKHGVDKIEAGYASERDQLKAHAEKLAVGIETSAGLSGKARQALAAYRKDFPSE